jgi:hypothetical protein
VTLAVAAQARQCHVLTLRLQDLQLELLGLKVDLSEVNLRLFGRRSGDGSGVLGRLFCTLSRSTIRIGRTRGSVTLVITSQPGRGVLGDAFCQLSGGPS